MFFICSKKYTPTLSSTMSSRATITPKKILIVKKRAIGDSIMGIGTVSYVRSIYPDARITYAIPLWISRLFENISTDADEILGFDLKSIGDWINLWKVLNKLKTDIVFEMHQSGRTRKFFTLYSLLTGTKYFFHNHHIKRTTNIHEQGVTKALIQRDLDGAWSCLSAKDHSIPCYLDFVPEMRPVNAVSKKRVFVFGVSASRETKMWPLGSYVGLSKKLLEQYPDYEIIVPLATTPSDLAIESELKKLALPNEVKIIKVSLAELPEHVGQGNLYVGNDTGLKHLSIALGLRSITIFGPEPPTEWHPYDCKHHPFLYKEALACRTKKLHYCGLSTCESMQCVKCFSVDDVFSKINGLIAD
nr:lipopolysaccharide core biosynthesis protein [uncultured archaeon GZfos18F2]